VRGSYGEVLQVCSGGIITLVLDPMDSADTVALDGGGTVALDSGGTVALDSGGTVALVLEDSPELEGRHKVPILLDAVGAEFQYSGMVILEYWMQLEYYRGQCSYICRNWRVMTVGYHRCWGAGMMK